MPDSFGCTNDQARRRRGDAAARPDRTPRRARNRMNGKQARSTARSTARATVAFVGLTLVVATGACTSTNEDPTGPTTTETSTTTTTTTPGPASDQTPPSSAFGMVHDGSKLWIADFYGGQVMAVDPD